MKFRKKRPRKERLDETQDYIFPSHGSEISLHKLVLGKLARMKDKMVCKLGKKECNLGKMACNLGKMVYNLGMKVYKMGKMVCKMMGNNQLDFSYSCSYNLDKMECKMGKMEYNLGKMVYKMGMKEYNLGRMVCSLGNTSLVRNILRLDRRLVHQHHHDKCRNSIQHPKIRFCSSFHNHKKELQGSSRMKA